MLPRLAAALFTTITLATVTASPVAAQELLGTTTMTMAATVLPGPLTQASLFPVVPVAAAEAAAPVASDFRGGRRPALLPALYISTIALQALDAHTTMTALKQGGTEANPFMKGVAGNTGALIAVKASAAVGTIYLAEKMWRRNRVGALALMAVVNGVTAAVVAHNYKVVKTLR